MGLDGEKKKKNRITDESTDAWPCTLTPSSASNLSSLHPSPVGPESSHAQTLSLSRLHTNCSWAWESGWVMIMIVIRYG
jgi:hypothetical protein